MPGRELGLRVARILIYPLKGAGGIELRGARVDGLGLVGDRRWMLVGPDGSFISQRTHPRLALLRVTSPASKTEGGGGAGGRPGPVAVEGPGEERRTLAVPLPSEERIPVRVHRDRFSAQPCGKRDDEWFSAFLGEACRLVYFPDDGVRSTDPAYAPGHGTTFTDGYPIHLTLAESLADLNRRMEGEVKMDCFRPNLVVEGGRPWEEDRWRRMEVGSAGMAVVKPCARCSVTLVDQASARVGREPLKTLDTFRRWNGKVYLGQNAVVTSSGSFETGADVHIVEKGSPRPPLPQEAEKPA